MPPSLVFFQTPFISLPGMVCLMMNYGSPIGLCVSAGMVKGEIQSIDAVYLIANASLVKS